MAVTRATIPSIEELRTKVLRDIRRGKIRAGVSRPNVSPGSESYIKAESWASTALEMHAKIALLQDATMADTAEGEDLERIASLHGLKRSIGAGATGFVKVQVTGTVTFSKGSECTLEDGVRAAVVVISEVSNNGLVPIQCIDVGVGTNRAAGTKVTWTSPPSGSADIAYVGDDGLTGGQDADTDAALRTRLLNVLRYPAKSGNWAHVAKWAEESSPSVEKAFVYPGAEGPSTLHVAISQAAKQDTYYSREITPVLVNMAAANIVANNPEHADVLTTACEDESVDMVLQLSLPDHLIDGGLGGSWLNSLTDRWPTVGGTTPFATRLSAAPTSGVLIRATTYSEPKDDAYIAIWSSSHKEFQHTRIKSHTFVSGTDYDITLYTAIDTNKIASGDYISMDAEKLDDYGATMALAFATLGPGEKGHGYDHIPRAYRHPLQKDSWESRFTSKHVGLISIKHDEVSHVKVTKPTSLPKTPATVTTVTDPPNILTLGQLAIYPL